MVKFFHGYAIIIIKKRKYKYRKAGGTMNMNKLPDILMGLSIVAVLLAGYDFLVKGDFLNLAGTQWILIAIALSIYGLYAKVRTA